MIEVYDIRDAEPEKLDITPELALAAYNTLIQFCRKQTASEIISCGTCVLYNSCPAITDHAPAPLEWEEIHYPRLIGNTIEYLKNGQLHKLTCSDRRDAEKKMGEMKNEIN